MATDDIQKQWEQDVANHGDDAYLWYKISIGYDSDSGFSDAASNQDVINSIHFRNVIVRKESFPFDLERAKLGDVVEWFDGNSWIEWDFKQFDCPDYTENYKMKYPPKVSNGTD